ncbi:MAG: DNA-processing protein DprA, partial [Pseudomonadota bacterium]
ETAFSFAKELGSRGIVIVSGGALGIDAAAHEGAIASGGKTVSVLGSGLGCLYPSRNKKLFQKIARCGALITPYSFLYPPIRHNFPERNQLIAGLAEVVVVVEAQHRSGALNTANWAKEQGIVVLSNPNSPGGMKLLSGGAGLATTVEDVLGVLATGRPKAFRVGPTDQDEQRVLLFLAAGPHTVDEVAAVLGGGPARAAMLLLRLEVAHLVRSLPGGRFEAVAPD